MQGCVVGVSFGAVGLDGFAWATIDTHDTGVASDSTESGADALTQAVLAGGRAVVALAVPSTMGGAARRRRRAAAAAVPWWLDQPTVDLSDAVTRGVRMCARIRAAAPGVRATIDPALWRRSDAQLLVMDTGGSSSARELIASLGVYDTFRPVPAFDALVGAAGPERRMSASALVAIWSGLEIDEDELGPEAVFVTDVASAN